MRHLLLASAACCCLVVSAHGQGSNPSATLNLTGATRTLDIDVNSMTKAMFASGEDPWWGNYQLAPEPLTSPNFVLSLGLPPNGAYPAVNVFSGKPYWSSWSGEYEAYPNYDMSLALASAGLTPPIGFSGGDIDLTASLMPLAAASTVPANIAPRAFLSGAFNSYPFSQRYGYFEITARIPSGQAEWPAFWLVPENMNTGIDTEIDIMEGQGSNPSNYWATLHSRDYALAGATSGAHGAMISAPADLSKGYHRYGVEWEADRVTFYLDGVAVCASATPSDMHVPMYIIANLAVGGWMGGPSSTTPASATFSISSLRVWQRPAG